MQAERPLGSVHERSKNLGLAPEMPTHATEQRTRGCTRRTSVAQRSYQIRARLAMIGAR